MVTLLPHRVHNIFLFLLVFIILPIVTWAALQSTRPYSQAKQPKPQGVEIPIIPIETTEDRDDTGTIGGGDCGGNPCENALIVYPGSGEGDFMEIKTLTWQMHDHHEHLAYRLHVRTPDGQWNQVGGLGTISSGNQEMCGGSAAAKSHPPGIEGDDSCFRSYTKKINQRIDAAFISFTCYTRDTGEDCANPSPEVRENRKGAHAHVKNIRWEAEDLEKQGLSMVVGDERRDDDGSYGGGDCGGSPCNNSILLYPGEGEGDFRFITKVSWLMHDHHEHINYILSVRGTDGSWRKVKEDDVRSVNQSECGGQAATRVHPDGSEGSSTCFRFNRVEVNGLIDAAKLEFVCGGSRCGNPSPEVPENKFGAHIHLKDISWLMKADGSAQFEVIEKVETRDDDGHIGAGNCGGNPCENSIVLYPGSGEGDVSNVSRLTWQMHDHDASMRFTLSLRGEDGQWSETKYTNQWIKKSRVRECGRDPIALRSHPPGSEGDQACFTDYDLVVNKTIDAAKIDFICTDKECREGTRGHVHIGKVGWRAEKK